MNKSIKVAKKCIQTELASQSTFNLITDTYEYFSNKSVNHIDEPQPKVINSAEVDTQILTAAVSILKLVISSNQFIRLPEKEQMQRNM